MGDWVVRMVDEPRTTCLLEGASSAGHYKAIKLRCISLESVHGIVLPGELNLLCLGEVSTSLGIFGGAEWIAPRAHWSKRAVVEAMSAQQRWMHFASFLTDTAQRIVPMCQRSVNCLKRRGPEIAGQSPSERVQGES